MSYFYVHTFVVQIDAWNNLISCLIYVQKHPALFCQNLDKAWARNTRCFYFFLRLNEVSVAINMRAVVWSSMPVGGLGFFPVQITEHGVQGCCVYVTYGIQHFKASHSVYSSRSERSLCVKSDTRLLHNLLIVGGQLGRGDLAFLQVEKLLLSSLGPSFVTVDITP